MKKTRRVALLCLLLLFLGSCTPSPTIRIDDVDVQGGYQTMILSASIQATVSEAGNVSVVWYWSVTDDLPGNKIGTHYIFMDHDRTYADTCLTEDYPSEDYCWHGFWYGFFWVRIYDENNNLLAEADRVHCGI